MEMMTANADDLRNDSDNNSNAMQLRVPIRLLSARHAASTKVPVWSVVGDADWRVVQLWLRKNTENGVYKWKVRKEFFPQ
jgi:hypothetical protein